MLGGRLWPSRYARTTSIRIWPECKQRSVWNSDPRDKDSMLPSAKKMFHYKHDKLTSLFSRCFVLFLPKRAYLQAPQAFRANSSISKCSDD